MKDPLKSIEESMRGSEGATERLLSGVIPRRASSRYRADPWGRSVQRRGLCVANLGEVVPERIAWLWPGRIAVGKMTMIAGDPGLGKSLAAMHVAATVTRGGE